MSALTDNMQMLVYLDSALSLLQQRREAVKHAIEDLHTTAEERVRGGKVVTKVTKPRFVKRWTDEFKARLADNCPPAVLAKFRKVSLDISGKTIEQVQKSADPDIVSYLPAFNALIEGIHAEMQATFDATAEDIVEVKVELDETFVAEMDANFMVDMLDQMGIDAQPLRPVAEPQRMIEPERQPELVGVANLPD